MSATEIESWIASSAAADPNFDFQGLPDFSWQRDQVLKEWPLALEWAQSRLHSSSTKLRVQFLQEELLSLAKHADLTLSQSLDVFKLLTETYPKYVDTASREAVEAVGSELVRRDELRGTAQGDSQESKLGITEQILGWLGVEVARVCKRGTASSKAPAASFVLLSWSCGIYTICLQTNPSFTSTNSWLTLVGVIALLLDALLDDANPAKPALRKSTVLRTRRAIRSSPKDLPYLMTTLLVQAKTNPGPLTLAPLLGMSVDVTLRLKNVKDEDLKRLSPEVQQNIVSFYANTVLMSKTPVPSHESVAFHDFIESSVSSADFTSTILPTMEKALLRSPENCLNAITDFFLAYPHRLDSDYFRRILTPTLNSAKSSNPVVRSNAVKLFKTIIEQNPGDTNTDTAFQELLALPKTGKTLGVDHRVALYSMLSFLSPSTTLSAALVQSVPPLLAKESHDAAVSALAPTASPHIVYLLRESVPLPPDVVNTIAKEMNSSKPIIRRAFCSMVGSVFWALDDLNDVSLQFATALLPAFETSLKNVAANPLNASAGPLEGYIALAVLLSPLSRSGKFDDFIARNVTAQLVISASTKPAFLVWDRVYQKLNHKEDETWLLRASEAALSFFRGTLVKNAQLRGSLGMVFIHLAVESKIFDVRRLTLKTLETLTARYPQLVHMTIRESLTAFIVLNKSSAGKVPAIADESVRPINKQPHLAAVLSTCALLSEDIDQSIREDLLTELLILGHHPVICGDSKQIWIEHCQRAHLDPHSLVDKHVDKLLNIIIRSSDPESQSPDAIAASYSAVTTLAFVAPTVAIPRFVDQLRTDLDPKKISALTPTEFGIWLTPEGVTFVDVLSNKKSTPVDKKGKDQEIARWEAELRQSLAAKKSASAGPLSKQDRALVEAQLQKESQIRTQVKVIKSNLERGLAFLRSLIAANTGEFREYVSAMSSLLLEGAVQYGSKLVGSHAFEAYLDLGKCCSERLETFRIWIGVATLRSLKVDAVPEEFQVEPLGSLVTRVLYRLRSQAEYTPYDAATFSYASALFNRVISLGGVAIDTEDDGLEQVTLTLDVIKFHCGAFADPAYPRSMTMRTLLHAIRYQPKLMKDASSALVDLGQAIHATATTDEATTLIRSTLAQEVYVRNACLQALQPFDLTDFDWSAELWLACHDEDEQNARLARFLWDDNGLDVPERFLPDLQAFLEHEHASVRKSCATAFAEATEHWPHTIDLVVSTLEHFYQEKAKVLAPEFDRYGMVIADSIDRADPWPTRLAIAQTFESLAPFFTANIVEPFFEFLIDREALGDRNPDVRRGMLDAGAAIIDFHGASRLAGLIAMFEAHLSSVGHATDTSDLVKEAVVVLFGRVARHLDSSDTRIPEVVDRLVEALKTPAEQVQIAVSDCLPPLVKFMDSGIERLMTHLLDELFNSAKYASRRGAAYGIAGVIKGLGISSIKTFNLVNSLRTAVEEKKRHEPRQGAMFVLETLSATLGRLFEPYVVHILPLLLTSFGDASPDVREAAQDASRVIMANLSGYGVKLILPLLLSGLDEKQWRTKKGSIELLGTMAFCAPKQLSISLPTVVPRLTGVLTDSHAQVRSSASKSLKQFGEVITNPEIQAMVPILLKAFVDPAKVPNALSALINTSFMHYIDSPSLALVIPILERGLKERGADTKRKAAQIVGNMASVTDSKDFVPYLYQLLPMVHVVLVDPVPEARATAAKALGTLVERLGEVHFPELVPSLFRTLKTDTSGVDRQGAAQGLSEVLSGLGMERLEGLLPDIIANAQSPRSTVREGFMSLLVYLPATFGTRFQPHLPKIITPILGGLSDSEEYVREAAMRAGRMIVTNYSSKATDLLLPELERGMFDPGWRIRHSSITLVGELLFKVSGISGKAEIEEDEDVVEAVAAESSRRALTEVLGAERRDRILSALYLVRQDAVNIVRQASIHIWKALVHNTPRTVREILPELISQIISLLANSGFEQQETAARTMGELCRKFGERILSAIIPILRTKSNSPDTRTREGVCLALTEIMENTTDTQREGYDDEIIAMVRKSLVDDEANVRGAAAKAFDTLQEHLGATAIDQTIPTLLEALRQPGESSGTALQALKEVMTVRSSTVFPVLIPTLIATPMTAFNARALASLVTVAGNALSKRLTVILGSLVKALETEKDEPLKADISEAVRALLASIADSEGLNTLMLLLLGWAKHEAYTRRTSACNLFVVFCLETEMDFSLYRIDWIRQLVSLLDDSQVPVHTAAAQALDAFVKSIPKDELEPLVVPLRRTIEDTGGPGRFVPGFGLSKSISPMVPIIIAGLTTGSNEQREQAAYAIGDLVERTEDSAIKPFVVPFTGPLIRVATQATTYPPAVKSALLSALTTMLERIPTFVKPFFPQLQRTFVKGASDPASLAVRIKGAQALGALMKSQPRVDPLITELLAGSSNNEDSIAASLVLSLAYVVRSAGENVGEKARESCVELVADAFKENHDESYLQAAAALFAALATHPATLRPIVDTHLLAGTPPSVLSSHIILAVLSPSESHENLGNDNLFQELGVIPSITRKIAESTGNESSSVSRPAREARELLKALGARS